MTIFTIVTTMDKFHCCCCCCWWCCCWWCLTIPLASLKGVIVTTTAVVDHSRNIIMTATRVPAQLGKQNGRRMACTRRIKKKQWRFPFGFLLNKNKQLLHENTSAGDNNKNAHLEACGQYARFSLPRSYGFRQSCHHRQCWPSRGG